jgi:hypothetical protein
MSVFFVSLLFITGPGQCVAKTYVAIGTAGTGGLWYPAAASISQLFNKYVGDKVKGTAVTSRGGTANLLAIDKKERLMGFDLGLDLYYAYTGTGAYKDKGPYKNMALGFMPAQTLCMNIWTTKEKGIKTMADIKGKKLAVPAPGASARIYFDDVYAAHGIDLQKDVTLSHGNMNEMNDMLTMGQIDVASWQTGLRASALLSFAETRNIQFVGLTDEGMKKSLEMYPALMDYEIPANTYKGQTKAVRTVGVPIGIVIDPELSEDLVYEMAKAIYDHMDELYESVESMKEVTIDGSLLQKMPIPYHPGVMKYFKEKNIPDIEAFEKRVKKAKALREKNTK